ncbi:acyltransferase family protein [Demequina sp. NBRC 110052]|uniref:acyltransferase family protein n=1 Tax=Demequina sp. NBRC 110052 TaxID=1570341 RepID=UPI0009FE6B26|nr:acyltransferase family protein [Demequina sp. NBRC 110052]
MAAAETAGTTRTRFRGDIQGLRTVAVLLVVAYHLTGMPSGGFIGVDVFFVISGFLIGGALFRQFDSEGRIGLKAFYWRRLWRLGPASLAAIVATVGMSFWLMSTARAHETLVDAGWTLLLVANLRFALQGVDYSNVGAADSPLLHFWSLAVEEQFYIIAPLAIMGAALLAPRVMKDVARRRVGVVLVVLVLLGASAWMTLANPGHAYFSLAARAWELAVGVFAALLVSVSTERIDRLRVDIAYVGLALIAFSGLWVSESVGFPFPWAIPAVLGSALVVWSGARGAGPAVLDNAPMRYLGDRSFAIYLWHFPAIAMVQQFRLDNRVINWVAALVLTFAATELSYRLVEKPLRAIGHGERPRWNWSRREAWTNVMSASAVVGAVGALVFAVVVRPLPQPPADEVSAISETNAPTAPAEPAAAVSPFADLWAEPMGPAERERVAQIEQALASTSWDDREGVIESAAYVDNYPECLGEWGVAGAAAQIADERCWFGDPEGDRTIYVAGDSNALSFVPAVVAAYPDAQVRALTIGQCPLIAIGTATFAHDRDPALCAEASQAFMDELERVHPDAVVLVTASSTMWRLASGATGGAAEAEWTEAFRTTLSELATFTEDVIVLDSLRSSVPIDECAWTFSRPSDCFATLGGVQVEVPRVQRAVVDELALDNVHYPQTLQWYCDAEGRCPAAIDGVAVVVDTEHLTEGGARALGPLLAERVPLDRSAAAAS